MKLKYSFIFFWSLILSSSCQETTDSLLDKAYKLSKEKKYEEANKLYSKAIDRNHRLEIAFYNRGMNFASLKKYQNALIDFDEIISHYKKGNLVVTFTSGLSEDDGYKISYNDALYQRAQVLHDIDSLSQSFQDFEFLIANNYEKSNCLIWQGSLWLKSGSKAKACACFQKAKEFAFTNSDKEEADRALSQYFEIENNYR